MGGAYPARVALQELDLLKELDVVRAQAVQLGLQGLDGVLGQAVLLGAAGWVNGWAGPAVEGVGGEASMLAPGSHSVYPEPLLGLSSCPGPASLCSKPGETPQQAEATVLGSLSFILFFFLSYFPGSLSSCCLFMVSA